MRFELLHPADQLVMIMDRIYQYGMTTTSGGNLSIRDDNGDIWITPSGIDKGHAHAQGYDLRKARWHSDRHTQALCRTAVPHRHLQAAPRHTRDTACASADAGLRSRWRARYPTPCWLPSVTQICGEIAMAKYEVPGSELLGQYISSEFAKGYNTVMLENHGVVCGASNLFRAFMAFETLDFAGRLEIDARKLGTPNELTQAQINIDSAKAHPQLDAFVAKNISSEECAARRDMCSMIHRAYDQRLFNSTQGTFSQRLSDGSFLITPYMKDRKYLEPEDLVRIKNGMCERRQDAQPLGAAASGDLLHASRDRLGHNRASAGHNGVCVHRHRV